MTTDTSALVERFREKQAEYQEARRRIADEQHQELCRQIESCTDRLFFGAVKLDKSPHECPFCGDVCEYAVLPTPARKFMYRRPMCRCEQTALEEQEQRDRTARTLRRAAMCREKCRLVGKLRRMTLDNLKPLHGTEEVVRTARDFVARWPVVGRGLVLSGACGCGKTHIAAALANALVDAGVRAEFWPGFELLREIRKGFGSDTDGELCDRLSRVELLVLDDLGNEKIASDERGDWAREQFLRIIYWRDVHELPIVVTTNLTPEGLALKLGDAAVSRLLGMCTWHEITAGDFRLRRR